jgi:hypothetical protein
MVRGHRSQSPVPCEVTTGIFEAPMAFERPTEFEWAEVDIPDAIIDFFEANIGSDADG